jgi:hypothetical protein
MWLNDEVKAAVVGGAAVNQPAAVRTKALGVLQNLACAAENHVAMWLNDEVKAALLGGAAVGQREKVRVLALLALSRLSPNPSILPSMVQAGVRDLLDEARTQQHFAPDYRAWFEEAFQHLVVGAGMHCNAGHAMEETSCMDGAYAKGGWWCDLCGEGCSVGLERRRWCCKVCTVDYCFSCRKSAGEAAGECANPPCAQCGEAVDNQPCSVCKSVWYCSKKHQREHWKAGHKQACKSLAAAKSKEAQTQTKIKKAKKNKGGKNKTAKQPPNNPSSGGVGGVGGGGGAKSKKKSNNQKGGKMKNPQQQAGASGGGVGGTRSGEVAAENARERSRRQRKAKQEHEAADQRAVEEQWRAEQVASQEADDRRRRQELEQRQEREQQEEAYLEEAQREQKEAAANRRLEEEKEEERRTVEQQRRVAEQVEAMAQLEREMAEMDAAEAEVAAAETAAVEAEQHGGGGDSKDDGECGGGASRENECVVCMEETRSCLFLPCRHMCVCRACADLIMASATANCPKCRTKVENIIDVFV